MGTFIASRSTLLIGLVGLCIAVSACTVLGPGAVGDRAGIETFEDSTRDESESSFVTRYFIGGDNKNKVGPSCPLDLVIDNRDQVWIHSEFSNSVLIINRETEHLQWIALPIHGPIFGFGKHGKTAISSLAEDIVFDGKDHVWLTQGGALGIYEGDDNHSRIVSVNIHTHEATSYPVPGDQNTVIGIGYDEKNNKIYYVEGSFVGKQPRLVSFHPGTIDTSFDFDNLQELGALRCYEPSDTNCYFTEEVPFAAPARIAIGPDGFIYMTALFGTHIIRYNPSTREFVELKSPSPRIGWSPQFAVSMPWDIDVDPLFNQVYWTEYPDEQVLRFDADKAGKNECYVEMEFADGTLASIGDSAMDNCITEYDATPPGEEGNSLKTHSLDVEQYGNVWFTTGNYVGVLARGESTPRFHKIEGTSFDGEHEKLPDHMTGIKVLDNEVWINSFKSKEVYRLRKDNLFQMMKR
jgi:streptogramin lyase